MPFNIGGQITMPRSLTLLKTIDKSRAVVIAADALNMKTQFPSAAFDVGMHCLI